jgi:flagellar assembly protein FliH
MPWSSKSILKKDEAVEKVLEYNPVKFELGTPSQALGYLETKKRGADFRMNDVIRVQTGVEKIEEESYEERIEIRALEKLKEVQEQAYQEGYKLGLDEGQKRAFEEHAKVIDESLTEMSEIVNNLKNMKKDICSFNEAHMVKLLFYMASKIAQNHLEYEQQPVIEVIRNAVELAQGEENVIIHVSEKQMGFLEDLQAQKKVEFEFLAKVKFVANPDISMGGCIIETNYGEVDARVEQRVEQLWTNLKENLPRVKDKLEG